MVTSLKLCVVLVIACLSATFGFAQAANEQGIKPYGAFHGGDLDQVNLSNGHLELRIPLISYPQRGGHLKLSYIVRYHNAVWNQQDDCAQGVTFCIHSWGFDQQPGMGFLPEQMPPLVDQNNVGNLNSSTPVATFTIRSADESQHPLGNIGGTKYESLDGTGMEWDSSSQTVTSSDGSRYSGIFGGSPILEDTNGNQILFNLGNFITDTMGRSITFAQPATQDFSGCTGTSPTSAANVWTVPGANGGTNTFKFCYTTVHVYTAHFPQTSTPDQKYIETNTDLSMLQSIVLPDGTAWTFEYSQPAVSGGVNWGDLVKVILPTGGSISYTWGHFEGCRLPYGPLGTWSGAIGERDIDANDGNGAQKWQYLPGQQFGQIIVRDPLNNDTVHTFTDLNKSCSLYETRVDTYNGFQNGGTLTKSLTTDYSWTPNVNVRAPLNSPPIGVVPATQTTIWANGQTKKTTFSDDAGFTFNNDWGPTFPTGKGIYGKETTRQDYDYGANAAGALLKSTLTSYWWQQNAQYITNNILDVPSSVTVQDGSGNTVSQTTVSYDQSIPGSSGIGTSHDLNPVNGNVRGNPTTTSHWLNGSTVSTTACPVSVTNGLIPTTKTFLDTGMASASTDACKQKSTYQYSAVYAGAFLTQSCNALSQCTNTDYDFNTGAVSSITDPNGQVTGKKTSFTYDNVGRLSTITYPDGGQTDASYPDATTVEIKKLQDAAANVWTDSFTYFDGWLRPLQRRLVDPEGDVFSETTYDALGRVSSTTNPHRSVAAPTDGSSIKSYDFLGRVLTVTEPDKNVIQTQYSDPGVVTLIDETGRRRRETFDALGRMVKVEEPTGTASGSQASASVSIVGSLQSKSFPTITAAPGTGNIPITGAVRFVIIDPCRTGGPQPAVASPQGVIGGISSCPQKIQDSGTVFIVVNGHVASTNYQSGSTAVTIASTLASAINSDPSAFVNASASNGTLTLTARTTGANTDYGWSVSSTSSDSFDFGSSGSFSSSPQSGALTGGATGFTGITFIDGGSITMTIDGYSATVNYGAAPGQDSTTTAIASDLFSGIKSQLPATNPPFSIGYQQGTAGISLVWGTAGASVSSSVTVTSTTNQTANFSNPSFAGCSITGLNPETCSIGFSGGADPFSLDASPSWATLYSYDLLGNPLRVEQHGSSTDSTQWRIRTFSYDSLSRLTQSNNPETGKITFTYDAAGNMVSKTDPGGVTVGRSYDALSRLLQETYSDGTPTASFAYDQSSSGGVTLANYVGRLTSTAAGSTGSIMSYDSMGRMTNEFVCLPSNCGAGLYSIAAQYDLQSHLTALTYPSGRTVTSAYNSAGRPLSSVLTSLGSQSENYSYYKVPQSASAGSWGYNPNGSLSQGTFGNGIIENYGYNNRSQLNAITASTAFQTWLSKNYGLYDSNGHNNGTIWSIADGISPSRNQTYQYDDVGRVISGSQQDGAFSQTFNYDAWGNMTTSGTNNFNPLYDGNNRIIGAPAGCAITTSYCYDADGNLLNDGVHQYTYDGYNRIKAVDAGGATYTYDAVGERIRKDTGGKSTEYINFAGIPIAEKDLSTGYWSDFVFFGGHRIARANNYEHQLHISGQVCANCGSQSYQFSLTNLGSIAGRTIQAGDTLRWLEWQNPGSSGGMVVSFTDGTDTNGMAIADQNGEQMSRSAVINQWDYRSASLTSLAGKQISQIMLNVDGLTQPGAWDIYFQDVVVVSADGSVWPLFSQNPTVPAMTGTGSTGMTSISTSINDCSGTGCAPINTTTYFHGDQIGSARLLSAGYGYPVWQGTFTPFGQEVSAQITTNHYKFSGKERGEASEGGLDYFGARYYSSVLGRWMTPDWSEHPTAVPYAGYGNPQSLNLYSFVTDDPLSHTDLDGHEQFTLGNDPNGFEANKTDACNWWCHTKKWFHDLQVANDRAYVVSHCKNDQCRTHYKNASEEEIELAERYLTDSDFHQQVDDQAQYMSLVAGARPKPPNLPAQDKVSVDVDHSIDGHTEGGASYQQSAKAGGNKDLWPDGYDKDMVEKAIRGAYDNASKVGRQFQMGGDILQLHGTWGGMTIEMWLDTATNTIRGYPVW